jgi:hypothetical protein
MPRRLAAVRDDDFLDPGIKIPEASLPSWLTEAGLARTYAPLDPNGVVQEVSLPSWILAHVSDKVNPHAVTKAQIGLGNVDNTSDSAKPISTATAAALAGKSNNGHRHSFTDLDGKISTAQLPPLAVNETFPVASQAAMLALVAERGDMAIRSDNGRTYVLSTDSPSTLADWKEVMAAGQVQSVAGKTGVVALAKGDVGLGSVDNTSDAAKPVSTAQQTALNLKADKSVTDAATSAPTASVLMKRDSSGRAQVAAPAAANDIANKSYVDTEAGTDAWVALTMLNGWTAYVGGGNYYSGLRARRVGHNIQVQGMIKNGAVGSTIANFPAGLIPTDASMHTVVAGNGTVARGTSYLIVGVSTRGSVANLTYDSGVAAPTFVSIDLLIPIYE